MKQQLGSRVWSDLAIGCLIAACGLWACDDGAAKNNANNANNATMQTI